MFNRFRGEFAKNQGDFKREDPDLFRAVHPNRILQTLGGIAQAYKALSPTGLVQNTGKILRGEPLFEIESMKKNTSESPSRFKNFYSAYMKTQNDKIKDLNNFKWLSFQPNEKGDEAITFILFSKQNWLITWFVW